MAGLRNIQVTATLLFDDGHVVTLSTPVWAKDIRNGMYFSDEMTKEILVNSGEGFAAIVEDKTINSLYGLAKHQTYEKEDRRRFKYGDSQSDN